ncbi:MAG: hypothetical protein DMF92_15205 [Acidobacteria bacterium]|nr:MAG: hypothetical protein DMF92_15205 [Acidobacteriota bacterium]
MERADGPIGTAHEIEAEREQAEGDNGGIGDGGKRTANTPRQLLQSSQHAIGGRRTGNHHMANRQEDDRKEEGAGAGTRGHHHATDMKSHTAGVLDEQGQAEQQETCGISG